MCVLKKKKSQVITRVHVKKWQIYVRKGSKIYKGKIVEVITDRKVAIEHSCVDDARSITMYTIYIPCI